MTAPARTLAPVDAPVVPLRNAHVQCPRCEGGGAEAHRPLSRCIGCDGAGRVPVALVTDCAECGSDALASVGLCGRCEAPRPKRTARVREPHRETCLRCMGAGWIRGDECPACVGSGTRESQT